MAMIKLIKLMIKLTKNKVMNKKLLNRVQNLITMKLCIMKYYKILNNILMNKMI